MSYDHLRRFLHEIAARPFRYGETDCALVLADWVSAARGIADPAAEFRGSYASKAECEAIVHGHGGLWVVVALCAKRASLERTDAPKPGDIAVVELNGRHWGAIMTPSGFWRIKANDNRPNGFKSCPVRRAWSVL